MAPLVPEYQQFELGHESAAVKSLRLTLAVPPGAGIQGRTPSPAAVTDAVVVDDWGSDGAVDEGLVPADAEGALTVAAADEPEPDAVKPTAAAPVCPPPHPDNPVAPSSVVAAVFRRLRR